MVLAKKIVVDAGPLIACASIGFLEILPQLFGEVVAPEEVAIECLSNMSYAGAINIQKAIDENRIKIAKPCLLNYQNSALPEALGNGEIAAIKYAAKNDIPLLIDEKLGRRTAKQLQITVIGTAGVLLLAKQHKLVNEVSQLISCLRNNNYYLSDDLAREVLKYADELPL